MNSATRTSPNIPALFPRSGNLEAIGVAAKIAKAMIAPPFLGLAIALCLWNCDPCQWGE
ncbi:MAG: hypothetical protein AAFW75_15030 [Cyanobacteria bacterium J06636_16]